MAIFCGILENKSQDYPELLVNAQGATQEIEEAQWEGIVYESTVEQKLAQGEFLFLLACLSTTQDVVGVLRLAVKMKPYLQSGVFRLMILSKIQHTGLVSKLVEMGVQEILFEPVMERAFQFKAKLILKSLLVSWKSRQQTQEELKTIKMGDGGPSSEHQKTLDLESKRSFGGTGGSQQVEGIPPEHKIFKRLMFLIRWGDFWADPKLTPEQVWAEGLSLSQTYEVDESVLLEVKKNLFFKDKEDSSNSK